MKIIICDDEKAYVDEIKKNVSLFMQERDIETQFDLFTDCKELFANDCGFYDIAFLDIEMGEIKGTQVAARLKEINPHIVIFIITSYTQYLDEAMDLNVFRFIKKPMDIERLYAGLEKAIQILDNTVIEVYVKNNKERKKVLSSDIVYVEIVGHTTKIVTEDGEYLTEHKMSYWKEKLTASFFYRVHSSFIINMKYITSYSRDSVVLKDTYTIPISYRTQAPFRKYFLKYSSWR